ncbi:MAG TPA: bifunctional phosphoglucose/phosphomannose isomerase [Candidatus Sulfotelmatobacter sp.]|nr:bifunctional phosphoglucose/phosphomannose isomerase [Candidatus Sulfotelmatobacter sp.]
MSNQNSIDKSNFRQFILDVPSQFGIGFDIAKNIKLEGEFTSLLVSGMGGSALPANLLKAYCENLGINLPIQINRSYSIPQNSLNKNTLNFVASYSGNTEETLSSLENLKENNLSFIGFSSGGKLEEKCKEYGMPHIKLPVPYPNYQPRMGTGYFFGSMYQVLINQGLVKDNTLELVSLSEKLKEKMNEYEQKGKDLSQKIKGYTPIIYSSSKFKSVAMIWKIKINENAKTPAFWNYFPELNHNEMVGFTNPQSKFIVLMLKDLNDNPKNQKRYEATANLLKEKGINSEIFDLEGENLFLKMFLSISLSDWTSYYLALEYGQDPTPVDMVEELKKNLSG